jgi:4-carboxymuconolactone decarboxylase
VYRFGKSLYSTRRVDETLYAEAVGLFGEPGVVELVGILGYYALVAMTLNVFAVRRGTDTPLPFAEG